MHLPLEIRLLPNSLVVVFVAGPIDDITRRRDRTTIHKCLTHSFDPESYGNRRNGQRCTELASLFRLAVVGSCSRGALDRQRNQLVILEILGSEQEDVVGLYQLPGTIREVRGVTQHRHGSRTERRQTEPNDGFFVDWTSRPVFAFGDV